MSGLIQVTLGGIALGGFVAYAIWTKARVWMLRQDLFAIRDRLWDEMRERGELDADVHRWYRDVVNEMIRFAPALSWWTLLVVLRHERELTPAPESARFDPESYPEPVAKAARDVERCVLRYLFRWSLLGWCIYAFWWARGGIGAFRQRLASVVERISRSNEVERIGRALAGA